jgi:hypothetical protein
MDLEKLTECQLAYILAVFTLTVPFGVFWQGATMGVVETAFYASIWVLRLHNGSFYAFHIFDLEYTFTAVSIGVFSILFALQIIRCFKRDGSRRVAYVLGLLTMLFPVGFGIPMMLYVLDNFGILLYMGPIPIQLALGLLILQKTEPKIITSPWMDEGDCMD